MTSSPSWLALIHPAITVVSPMMPWMNSAMRDAAATRFLIDAGSVS
jgi:hypothetical protein